MFKRITVFTFFAVAVGLWAGHKMGLRKTVEPTTAGLPGHPPPLDVDNAGFAIQLYAQRPGHDFDMDMDVTGTAPRTPVRTPGDDPLALSATVRTDAAPVDGARLYFDVIQTPDGRVDGYLAAEVGADGRCRLLQVESGSLNVLAESTEPAPFAPASVRVRRRRPQIELVVDGRVVLRAAHEGWPEGAVAVGRRAAWSVSSPRVQPVAPILFTDDFMRTPDEADLWHPVGGADFTVRSMANPGRSANAFVLQGQSRVVKIQDAEDKDTVVRAEGAVLTGAAYWDGYHMEVAVNPAQAATVGLVLSSDAPAEAVDGATASAMPARYALVRWVGERVPAAELERVAVDEPLRETKTATEGGATPAELTPEAVAAVIERLPAVDPLASPLPGRFEIVEVANGAENVLASVPGGFRPGRWYRLHARLNRGAVRAGIDGLDLLVAESPWFSGGLAGLYVRSASPVEFDDFKTVTLETLDTERLRTADADAARHDIRALAWRPYGGRWEVVREPARADAAAIRAALSGPFPALAITGLDEDADFTLSASVGEINRQHGVGLVGAFRDPANYIALEYNPEKSTVALTRRVGGERHVLAEGPAPADLAAASAPWNDRAEKLAALARDAGRGVDIFPDFGPAAADFPAPPPVALALRLDRGHVSGAGLDAFVADLKPGRVGVMTFATDAVVSPESPPQPRALFHTFAARPLNAPLPPPTRNEITDGEDLMTVWSGARGEWRGGEVKNNPSFDKSYWHRGLFFHDVEMETLLPETWADDARLSLSLAKPRTPSKPNNGYYCHLESEALAGADPTPVRWVLRLAREEHEVARHTFEVGERPRRVGFRRAGPILVVEADGETLLAWRDPEPLAGDKVAWASKGLDLGVDAVTILSRAYLDYSFNEAPADWRVAGGVWEVTNRWECDPRWAFMTGMPVALANRRMNYYRGQNDETSRWKADAMADLVTLSPTPKTKLAALWHKRPLAGDFLVESYMAQIMDNSKGGYQNFVKNFNMTVCGDGRDLTRGYTCVFGGWGNTRSAILRNGVVVAESREVIPVHNENLHHQWFRVRVEREGPTIHFVASTQRGRNRAEDDLMRLSFTDPDPLPGGHVAIWSHDNGIAVARTRLAAEIIGPAENPLTAPSGGSPVFYD